MKLYASPRRISPRQFFAHLVDAFRSIPQLPAAMKGGGISAGFRERIMLAVTEVNGCKYCNYYHTGLALKSGMSRDQVAELLRGNHAACEADETVALNFSQHYADTNGSYDPEAGERLEQCYGKETSRDILALIRMIMIGNHYGIAFEDFIERLRFRGRADSSIARETGILFGILFMIPMAIVMILAEKLSVRKIQV